MCYRVRSGEIEFLLVRTRGSRRWTFPKGSAEPGLTPAEAAALEAFEEAGVHGRMERASFARYISRKRGKAKANLLRKETVIKAHLCEVLRLSKPKEPGRNRTWFSAQEAKSRLGKGRDSRGAAEFAHILEKAVSRILRAHGKQQSQICYANKNAELQAHEPSRVEQELSRQVAFQKDGLQKVQFEARPVAGWDPRMRLLPNGVSKLETMRRDPSVATPLPRKLLQGDILPFDRSSAMRDSDRGRKPIVPDIRAKR